MLGTGATAGAGVGDTDGIALNSGAGVAAGGATGIDRAADAGDSCEDDGGPDAAGIVFSPDNGDGVVAGGVGRAIGGAPPGREVPGIGMFAAGSPISVRAIGAGGRA